MGGANTLSREAGPPQKPPSDSRYIWGAICVIFLITFVGSIEPGIPPRHAWNAIELERVALITKAMIRYADDHQGRFPTGRSSTEVFQKLLEGGDADYFENRASLFYYPGKGKTPARDGQPLKPENVSFDVTGSADSSDPADLPLVFSTGFNVSYEPGASAKRLGPLEFRWRGFELFRPDPGPSHTTIVVGTQQQIRTLFVIEDATNPNGSAPSFIPANFKANGKTYQQLTPDGVLPNK